MHRHSTNCPESWRSSVRPHQHYWTLSHSPLYNLLFTFGKFRPVTVEPGGCDKWPVQWLFAKIKLFVFQIVYTSLGSISRTCRPGELPCLRGSFRIQESTNPTLQTKLTLYSGTGRFTKTFFIPDWKELMAFTADLMVTEWTFMYPGG